MWAKDSYLAPFFSSFSINQDIDEFATTLASKNDQNGNQLITAVFQDTYILITQEASNNQANYYLLSPINNVDVIAKPGEYRYALYLPKATFRTHDDYYIVAMPYHLLCGQQVQCCPSDNSYGSIITFQLVATPEDIYDFYNSISTCIIGKRQDGVFIVEDKTSGQRLKITIDENRGVTSVTFEILYYEHSYIDIEKSNRYTAGHEAIKALMQEFGADGTADMDIKYPDDYGGVYFDEEGYLWILTTKVNLDDISFLSDNPDIKGCVNFRHASYSYNELRNLQRFTTDYMPDFGICSVGIFEPWNVIKIHLLNLQNKEKLLVFLRSNYENFDESMIMIIQGEKLVFA